MDGSDQIVADASDKDHGRDGPHDKNYRHVRLLLRREENASDLLLVPEFGTAIVLSLKVLKEHVA